MRVAGTPNDEIYVQGEIGRSTARELLVTHDPAFYPAIDAEPTRTPDCFIKSAS